MRSKVSRRMLTFCGLGLLICWIGAGSRATEQFVELTAELECDNWSYWFLEDQRNRGSGKSIFPDPLSVRCVVGTNAWMMEGEFAGGALVTRWFTGNEILEQTTVMRLPSDYETEIARRLALPAGNIMSVGQKLMRTNSTADGNPGRPIRVMDLMELRGRVCWLAFCSGPVLQREGRQLYPPSDLWKNLIAVTNGFAERTLVFEDGLGLPRSIELSAPSGQRVFQYQVRETTSVGGWTIPLEFYAIQYRPAKTNGWEVQMTVKGRVTSARLSTNPPIPPGVTSADRK